MTTAARCQTGDIDNGVLAARPRVAGGRRACDHRRDAADGHRAERMGDLAAHVAKTPGCAIRTAASQSLRPSLSSGWRRREKMVVTAGQTLNDRNIQTAQELRLRRGDGRASTHPVPVPLEATGRTRLRGGRRRRATSAATSERIASTMPPQWAGASLYVVTGEFPKSQQVLAAAPEGPGPRRSLGSLTAGTLRPLITRQRLDDQRRHLLDRLGRGVHRRDAVRAHRQRLGACAARKVHCSMRGVAASSAGARCRT